MSWFKRRKSSPAPEAEPDAALAKLLSEGYRGTDARAALAKHDNNPWLAAIDLRHEYHVRGLGQAKRAQLTGCVLCERARSAAAQAEREKERKRVELAFKGARMHRERMARAGLAHYA
ncbi:hypothetical protein Q8F55_005813 [Vanrija albida]|uniref:Uncharacterized protein n=1 Tax=Vanrija albida TaxID=181172 RepID=A0ABR3Q384_9TREE